MKLKLEIIRKVKTNDINAQEVFDYVLDNMKKNGKYGINRLNIEVYLFNNIRTIMKLFAGIEIQKNEFVHGFKELSQEVINLATEAGIPLK